MAVSFLSGCPGKTWFFHYQRDYIQPNRIEILSKLTGGGITPKLVQKNNKAKNGRVLKIILKNVADDKTPRASN